MQTISRQSVALHRILTGTAIALSIASCGKSDSTAPPVAVLTSVVVTSPSQSVVAGQTVQLTGTPRDQNGNAISASVSWASSVPAVASVSQSGLVTTVAAGVTTITATATAGSKSVQGSIGVTVTALPVLTSVSVSAPATTLVVGGTLQVTGTPKDQNGAAIAATVTYASSATGVASVSASGLVTAVAAGTATITATAASGATSVSSTLLITVTAAPVLTSVSLSTPPASLSVGATTQLTASTKDQFGAAFSATVSWSSSASGVASVSSTGLVSGVSLGTATITASATSGGVTVNSSVQITVAVVPLASVTISAPSTSALLGNTIQLSAVAKDQNGAVISATITWASSATGTASVGASSGLVTGVAAGSATITATAVANGVTVTNTVVITITAAPVLTSVTISASSSSVVVGSTLQFTASPKDQFGNSIASTLTWSSSVLAKATISNTGLVTGVAAGTSNISVSATAGGVTVASAPTTITVNNAFPATASVDATTSLTFSPSSVDIVVGGSVTWNFQTLHNVTFAFAPGVPANIPNTSSGSVGRSFNTAGTFNYQCTLHPGMNGVVIVH